MRIKRIVQLVALCTIIGFIGLLISNAFDSRAVATRRGEEVYASHDCTDCHLALPTLLQKREKKEAGLIRVRKKPSAFLEFLSSDPRHDSFAKMAAPDRADLVEFLKSLSP